MKIWKSFGSSHSSDITIVGEFNDAESAQAALDIISDLTLASWEERYASMEEFIEAWKEDVPNLPYIGLLAEEFESGFDNSPKISVTGNEVKLAHLRNNNIGGIIKLMRYKGAGKITIE